MNPAGEHCVQDWEMENEAFVMATFLYQFKQLNYHHLCFQAVINQSNPGFRLIISELLKGLDCFGHYKQLQTQLQSTSY